MTKNVICLLKGVKPLQRAPSRATFAEVLLKVKPDRLFCLSFPCKHTRKMQAFAHVFTSFRRPEYIEQISVSRALLWGILKTSSPDVRPSSPGHVMTLLPSEIVSIKNIVSLFFQ